MTRTEMAQRRREIIEAARAGLTPKAIAAKFQLQIRSVYAVCQREGVPTVPQPRGIAGLPAARRKQISRMGIKARADNRRAPA